MLQNTLITIKRPTSSLKRLNTASLANSCLLCIAGAWAEPFEVVKVPSTTDVCVVAEHGAPPVVGGGDVRGGGVLVDHYVVPVLSHGEPMACFIVEVV